MIEFVRRYGKRKGQYVVYTEDEAKEKGIKYKYWKDLEVADIDEYWGLSDDGYVGETWNVRFYQQKRAIRKEVKLSYGASWVTQYAKIEFLKNYEFKNYSNMIPDSYEKKMVKTTRAKRFSKLVAEMRVTGNYPLSETQLATLGRVYDPKENMPIVKAKFLLKNKDIQSMVDDEIKRILNEQGTGRQWTADMAKKIVEKAIQSGDFSSAHKALDRFERWNEMQPNKTEQTNTLELNAFKEIEGLLEGKKLKLEQKTKGEVHESIGSSEEVGRGLGDSSNEV